MGSLMEAVEKFLVDDNWSFHRLENKPILRMGFKGRNGRWECMARIREEAGQIIYYSSLAAFVPEEKRLALAEFITRANYGMYIGNFEMDFVDGEVRFKTSLDVEGVEETLTPTVIRHLIYANVSMMDKYFPGLMSVVYCDVVPAEAIAKIEGRE
ncbi:MAG: YbjN domain-containing protein [Thermodesulfobacteriota bacterium]